MSHSGSYLSPDISPKGALGSAMLNREKSKQNEEQGYPESENEWHSDPSCKRAIVRLNDILCTYERMTGNENSLFIIPLSWGKRIFVSQNGKPVPDSESLISQLLLQALCQRGEISEEEMEKILTEL